MLLTQTPPPEPEFQLSGQVRLSPPPDPDMPYTFGEIVRYDGAVVTAIGNPDERGNETFFIIYARISAEVATQMRQAPTAFAARFYTDAGLVAEGTLQFGHAFTHR